MARARVSVVLLAVALCWAPSRVSAVEALYTVNSAGDAADLGDQPWPATTWDTLCDTGGLVGGQPECTLRAAIFEARALLPPDTAVIRFEVPGGPALIQPATPLPAGYGPITLIDGTTQPGARLNTTPSGWDAVQTVTLDGSLIPGSDAHTLLELQSGATLQDIAFTNTGQRPSLVAVSLQSDALVRGCLIGRANEGFPVGAWITGSFENSGNRVGGLLPEDRNLISGKDVGVLFEDSFNGRLWGPNYVQGNLGISPKENFRIEAAIVCQGRASTSIRPTIRTRSSRASPIPRSRTISTRCASSATSSSCAPPRAGRSSIGTTEALRHRPRPFTSTRLSRWRAWRC